MSGALVAVSGLCFGLGVVGVAASWRAGTADSWQPGAADSDRVARTAGTRSALWRQTPMLALAGACGAVAGLATGWPVAVPIGGVAALGLPVLFRQTSGSVSIAKIEAIATWTEMLQGTLAASAGLGQAIVATAPLSPPPIRDATTRLSARLSAGMHPHDALLQFADELEDPCADRVICALQLAVASRAQRVGDLLAALADSTRDEVALRLRIEVSRASVRSGVRTVLVFSLAFAAGLALLARSYLAPFGSTGGQLVLLVVGALYATGFTLMVAMSRPPAPVRLLGHQVVAQ
jgi:tight adherence protein B